MKQRLSVNVRFAELEDLDFCSESDYDFVTLDILRNRIEEKAVVVAEVGGELVGYLRIEYFWLTIPYLHIIGVNEEYQRKGIGTTMVGFLEEHLLKQRHKVLYSSSTANEPEPQAWHRALGFEECGFIAGINEGGIGEKFFRKVLEK
jgi:ribosomal protein S18 acetylase RimI-like enzyme